MDVQFHKIKNHSYQEVWDFQTLLHNDLKIKKSQFQKKSSSNKATPFFLNHMIFCEHKHVLTIGKSPSMHNLITSEKALKAEEIELFKINRGGDITYHGPGQLTGYLIFDLELLYRDVHKFVSNIEESIIRLLALYDLKAFRLKEHTGVWIGEENNLRKICAIGVHLSRWVSLHGFAFNINTDLSYFKNIIPCGINESGKSVTSLAAETGNPIDASIVEHQLKIILSEVFDLNIID